MLITRLLQLVQVMFNTSVTDWRGQWVITRENLPKEDECSLDCGARERYERINERGIPNSGKEDGHASGKKSQTPA